MRTKKMIVLLCSLCLGLSVLTSCAQSDDDYSDLSPEEELASLMEGKSSPEIEMMMRQMNPEDSAYFGIDHYSGDRTEASSHQVQSSNFSSMQSTEYSNAPARTASADYNTKRVNIVDRGLGKVMFTVEIPVSWQVQQNIYTDPQNGYVQAFQLDYSGPNGEWIKVVKPAFYRPQYGQDFQGVWNQLFQQAIGQHLQNPRMGDFMSSRKPLTASSVQKAMSQYPGNYEGYEQSFSGQFNGQVYEGKASIVTARTNMGGIIMATVALSPQGLLNSTLTILDVMNGTVSSNSEAYRQAMVQAGKRGLAASAAQHDQRMSELHAQTQRMYRDLSNQQSADNADFSRNMRASGLGYNGNTHTANDQFTDYLTDSYTIENPYTGLQERVDNTYQYWFVNAAGEYRGTNDPNLDLTNVPGGTWQRANRVGN